MMSTTMPSKPALERLSAGVSALLGLCPRLVVRIGYFGGGIGAMALAWDGRIARGHLQLTASALSYQRRPGVTNSLCGREAMR